MRKRKVAVWFSTKSEELELYPMVMVEDDLNKRYYYRVTLSSLKRLQCIVRSWANPDIFPGGWGARNYDH